jgi:hypothetical protein
MPPEAVVFLFVLALGGFTLLAWPLVRALSVDFTERMLAKQGDAHRLPRG